MIRFGLKDRMLEGGDYHVGVRRISDAGFTGPLHTHRGFHEIMVGLESSFTNRVGKRVFEHKPGVICFLAETDLHQVEGRNCRWVNIAFTKDYMEAIAAFVPEHAARVRNLPQESERIQTRLNAVELEAFQLMLKPFHPKRKSPHAASLFRQLLLDLLLRLVCSRERPDQSPDYPDWLETALRDFERLSASERSRQRLLKLAACTEEHLCRSFRRFLDSSPSQYINRLRLEEAAERLRDSSEPIADVGFAVGFNNLNYFHRRFRERYGHTPNAYRKAHRETL